MDIKRKIIFVMRKMSTFFGVIHCAKMKIINTMKNIHKIIHIMTFIA